MTKSQIAAAMKDQPDPVVLHVLAAGEDPGAVLMRFQARTPKHVGVYLRRPSIQREDGIEVGQTPAAIMGRVKV